MDLSTRSSFRLIFSSMDCETMFLSSSVQIEATLEIEDVGLSEYLGVGLEEVYLGVIELIDLLQLAVVGLEQLDLPRELSSQVLQLHSVVLAEAEH